VLKFYIRVNKYDPENVQKGRIMLSNIGEELKSYAKITVSPVKEDNTKEKKVVKKADGSKKNMEQRIADLEKENEEFEKMKLHIDAESDEEDEHGLEHIYMELESTVCFGEEYDIDKMLEQSSLEEILKDVYKGGLIATPEKPIVSVNEADDIKQGRPDLEFDENHQEVIGKAQERIRLKRKLRAKSAIFDMKEESEESQGIDLTKIDDEDAAEVGLKDDLEDLEMMKASINPNDIDALRKLYDLENRIDFQKETKRLKAMFKRTLDPEDSDPYGVFANLK
jgi:hypothetical protein